MKYRLRKVNAQGGAMVGPGGGGLPPVAGELGLGGVSGAAPAGPTGPAPAPSGGGGGGGAPLMGLAAITPAPSGGGFQLTFDVQALEQLMKQLGLGQGGPGAPPPPAGGGGMVPMASGGKVTTGPVILHVGERGPNDKKYASDEFVFADPGPGGSVVVAPRPRDMPATLGNAIKLLREQARGTKMVKAQGGASVGAGGNLLAQLLTLLMGGGTEMATQLPLTQLAIMQAFGTIIPEAIGVTDPQQFRDLLFSNLMLGGAPGVPTLQSQQQTWNQSLQEKLFGLQERGAAVQEGTLGLQREGLGLESRGLDLQAARDEVAKMLGLGGLEVERGGLDVRRGELGLSKQTQRYNETIRGLKAAPGAGNIPSYGGGIF